MKYSAYACVCETKGSAKEKTHEKSTETSSGLLYSLQSLNMKTM